jgi:hypothetical protein
MLKKTLLALSVAWTGTAAAASNSLDEVTMNIVNETDFQEIITANPAEIERTLLAAEATAGPAPEVVARAAPASTNIEEVEIVGQRPLRFLIAKIERMERQMFDTFNELNDVDEFRVVCRSSSCVPVYFDRAKAQDGVAALSFDRDGTVSDREFLSLGIPPKSDAQIWFENRDKTEAFNAKIRALALEHPELAKSMLELNAEKLKLEVLQQRQRERTKAWLHNLLSGDEGD